MTPERLIIESMFRIPNKDGKDVDFILNEVQARLDEARTNRNIIPKARQRGVSSYIVALFLAVCLSQRNQRCVVVSHTVEATTKLLDKVRYILDNFKGGTKAQLRYATRNELVFEKTGSVFYAGTAGNDNVGVGDTINWLHCSEPALWANPTNLLKGIFNAVAPQGTIFIEGTGNGMGNWYHRQCMRAAGGNSEWQLHFFSWTDAAEYAKPVLFPEAFKESLDDEEKSLFANGVLTLEQIAWRRNKIEDMDYDVSKFREQYPLSFEECFQGTGNTFFHKVNYQITPAWKPHPDWNNTHYLEGHPNPRQHYFAAVDIGAGVGLDNTVLEIFSIEEMRQVLEWSASDKEPHTCAQVQRPILEAYKPYINPERNNHGPLYIKELIGFYPIGQVHMSRPPRGEILEYGKIANFGTFTSGRTRPEIVGSLRKMVGDKLIIHSPMLKAEMDSFVEGETGKLEAQQGCFDDRVLASGLATYIYPRAAGRVGIRREYDEGPPDPFGLEGILKQLEETYGAANQPDFG